MRCGGRAMGDTNSMGGKVRIKICGLRRPEDIEAANRLLPDYIGLIFWPGSRRAVTAAGAAALRERLDPRIVPVGVFVDAAPEEIAALASAGTIGMAQLHGQETEEYIARLRAMTDIPVMKAYTVRGPEDLRAAAESSADYVLLDNGKGTGRTFDWGLLAGPRDGTRHDEDAMGLSRPWFLAGGLTPENVEEAVRRFRPFAVDLNSGLETDGYKDPGKMAAAAAALRGI